jgi:hypothetical protein
LNFQELRDLRAQPFVREGQVTINRDLSLEVVVEEAGAASPAIIAWLEEHGLAVESAAEYNPPFDDIFVMLLNKVKETGSWEGEASHA